MKTVAASFLLATLLLVSVCAPASAGEDPAPAPDARGKAALAMKNGNWKDAYESFSRLALDPKNADPLAATDLSNAVVCLQNLNRLDEMDEFCDQAVAAHPAHWRLLFAAAQSYTNSQHMGYIVAGKFSRGHHRGGGQYVNTLARDRVRALQLLQQAMEKTPGETDKNALYNFYQQFAGSLMGQGYHEAWRLQYLTDLATLPDYEQGWNHGGQNRGAPVAADGTPVYHKFPKTYAQAQSDGERWRYLLMQAMETLPANGDAVRCQFASFLRQQFDVQSMAQYGRFGGMGRGDDGKDGKEDESGPYAVQTLGEDETIARLATGIKRFKLPDEFNFIKLYQDVAQRKNGQAQQALRMLGQIFEDRRQYEKAAVAWKQVVGKDAQDKVQQIIGNWGLFEPLSTQIAGQGAAVEYRYRNGQKVSFTAHEIDVSKLLADVKAFLKTNPQQRNDWWAKVDISNIGYRLIEKQERQYVGAQAAAWDLDLKPRERHFDRRITVATPLQKPGAYLLVARMAGGNESRIVVWVADTVIVKKPLEKGAYYFVADALTGKPIPGAELSLFGYRQEWRQNKSEIFTTEFAATTDADGQMVQDPKDGNQAHQWLITANAKDGRFAFLGFTHVWHGNYYDHEYNQTKTFSITDRPVYRPGQPVKFKFWINQAQYDREGKSPYAGQSFTVRINNPKGEKAFEKAYTADEFGGLDGEFALVKSATLGAYSIQLLQPDNRHFGGGSFRVEEYKKPEFEVKIDAPSEPVMLGEKIVATINAKYYFGAPVTEAKVKYKVLRYTHSANWYPMGIWDWFYQPGYWWFACDYPWYPGWRDWGCCRPSPWWWGVRQTPPEIVMENEVPVGADGTVKVELDTAAAKAMQGDTDHRYEFTAEVTDQSRRTIVGQGKVLVARKPFKVYTWVDRGHYRVGDVIQGSFSAQTLDNKPVQGKGELRLLKLSYGKDARPIEAEAQKWNLDTDAQGRAQIQIKAAVAGQYRLSYQVTDSKKHALEGGYVFCVSGEGFDGGPFRFNDLELVTDKREYKPGEPVRLMVNTNRAGGTVVLFARPANGVYRSPKLVRLAGKSAVEAIEVVKKDMPNFFIEAFTVSDGKVYTETREIVVPPESRVLNVEITPSTPAVQSASVEKGAPVAYKPGEKAKFKLKLSEMNGEPFAGSAVVSIYDKAVEYISGGSNVQEIKSFFWKWRRSHQPSTESSVTRSGSHIARANEPYMHYLGVFGALALPEDAGDPQGSGGGWGGGYGRGLGGAKGEAPRSESKAAGMPMAAPAMANAAPGDEMEKSTDGPFDADRKSDAADKPAGAGGQPDAVEPSVRKNFADTAYWTGALNVGANGLAEIELTMPENLTNWKVKTWAMGSGARVGQGETEVLTTKNLIVRLQAPRFFTQKDEVVLSANVHNYLKTKKSVKVSLETEGGILLNLPDGLMGKGGSWSSEQTIEVEPKGEKRVDWRVKVLQSGEAVVRMKALTDEESDAMEMRFPAYVHGMSKMESFCGSIRPEQNAATVAFSVPKERRPEESRLEVRYSPTLAGAMVDALPYLSDYPYGCTEQTLNRFLPTVITQNVLMRMNLKLKDIREKISNLNAQEIGNDKERAKQWQRYQTSPVFDEAVVKEMALSGVARLASMQVSDGGWGWFSGHGEYSYPHTTAYVVHGLQIARENDVQLQPNMLERGVAWLKNNQAQQVQMIKNAPSQTKPWKTSADNLDAFVYMVLADAKLEDAAMREFLYRDRNHLAVYSKAMFALAMHKQKQQEKLEMLKQNIEQFLVQDDENQTAHLKLPNDNYWWYWYGSEYEAHAYYLKLLAAVEPKGEKGPRLVKYLINNRKHSTYWNSTRDTAVCLEAFADYIKASGEDKPDLKLEIFLDGQKVKEVAINASNLFSFDNAYVLSGEKLTPGPHKLEFKKSGQGPLYFNAYVTNFTLEDHLTKAGLEIKVERKYYKLKRVDKTEKAEGARGQVLNQKAEKYAREPLANLAQLKSGELVEVELEIESKNDYEYILFEDMKAAGFEPVDVRSGYTQNSLGAYMELRDERVCFFVRALARGKHSVSYRLRAEIPGKFSALPTRASAMYAPELKANSDEIKLLITD